MSTLQGHNEDKNIQVFGGGNEDCDQNNNPMCLKVTFYTQS